MKVSLNWIKDYVDLPQDMDLTRLAYDLTMSTVEVEGAEDLARRFDHMLVGRIVEVCPHPNADKLQICRTDIGGGDIRIEGRSELEAPEVYREKSFAEIADYCKTHNLRISDYVEQNEGPEIWDFLFEVWHAMCAAIQEGLTHSGTLPGGLNVERKAQYLYNQRHIDERPETRENRIVCAYAFAVSEQNASQGTIVTAPTCGSCGVLPAVLMYMQHWETRSTGRKAVWQRKLLTTKKPTRPSPARSAAVRPRSAPPAPWPPPRWRSCSRWASIRSNTRRRWRWSTISA